MHSGYIAFEAVFLGGIQVEPGYRARDSGLTRNHRLLNVGGIGLHLVQAVRYLEPGGILIGTRLKPQCDHPETVLAFAAHLHQSLQGFQFFFLLIDNVPLNLQGARPGPVGCHCNFRLVHVRRQLYG